MFNIACALNGISVKSYDLMKSTVDIKESTNVIQYDLSGICEPVNMYNIAFGNAIFRDKFRLSDMQRRYTFR